MRKTTPIGITITWRNENYGGVVSEAALRFCVDDDRETKHQVVRQIIKRHGFSVNEGRCAWIAGSMTDERLEAMVADFEAKGFVVEHAGATPDIFCAPAPSM